MTQPENEAITPSRSGRTALEVSIDAAQRAGQIIRERFLTEKEISFKGRADIVTDVDLAAEKVILDLVREEYPQFSILSEESNPIETGSPYTWVIDPIDGTRNFAEGIPHFCVVVALAKGRDMVVGVTYDPIKEETFTAELGRGAFLNGAPIARVGTAGNPQLCAGVRPGLRGPESGDGAGYDPLPVAGFPDYAADGVVGPGDGLRRRRAH